MSDQPYKIRIGTEADSSGLQAVTAGLERLDAAAAAVDQVLQKLSTIPAPTSAGMDPAALATIEQTVQAILQATTAIQAQGAAGASTAQGISQFVEQLERQEAALQRTRDATAAAAAEIETLTTAQMAADAAGDTGKSQALAREIAMRRDVTRLVREQGISEAAATAIVRQRTGLADQIAERTRRVAAAAKAAADAERQAAEAAARHAEQIQRQLAPARELINTLKMGVGIDLGGRIVNSIAQIPRVVQAAVQRGVEFNSVLEGTESAVAAVLERFQGMSRPQAIAEAAKAMEDLKAKAIDAPGTIQTLSEAWMASSGAAAACNISVSQQIDLMIKLSQACSRLNLPQQQLVQETRAILTGNITLDAQLAKTLGITNQMIAKAKEQGSVYEFVTGKIGALGEAADTYEVRLSNMHDAIDQALGEATKPIFDELREAVLQLGASFSDPKTISALKELGFEIAGFVALGVDLADWAVQNAGLLAAVAKGATLLSAAFAAIKLTHLLASMGALALGLGRSKTALAAETAELAKNTAGQVANAASRTRMQKLIGTGPGMGGRIAGAANVGLGLGMVGYGMLMDYAAGINAETARSGQLGEDVSNLANSYDARIRAAASVAEKEAIIKDLTKDIADLNKNNSDVTGRDAEFLELGNKQLNRMLESAKKLDEEKLKLAQKDEEAAAELEKQKQLAEEHVEDRKKYEAQYKADAERRALADRVAVAKEDESQSADRGEVKGHLRGVIEELEDKLNALPRIEDPAASAKDVQARDSEREFLADLIKGAKESERDDGERVTKARDAAAEKEKQERVKALREQIAYTEAQGKKRLAEIEAAAGSEAEIARQRMQVEADIAARRLALEHAIGNLENESDTARATRQASADADALSRAAQLAQARKRDEQSEWDQGAKEGAIDARSQRHYGLRGDVIEEKGAALYGRSALGGALERSVQRGLTPLPGPAQDPAAAADATAATSQRGGAAGAGMDRAASALQSSISQSTEKLVDGLQAAKAAVDDGRSQMSNAIGAITNSLAAQAAAISALRARVEAIART